MAVESPSGSRKTANHYFAVETFFCCDSLTHEHFTYINIIIQYNMHIINKYHIIYIAPEIVIIANYKVMNYDDFIALITLKYWQVCCGF